MKTITELAEELTAKMKEAGYTQCTTWMLYIYSLLPLIRHHHDNGTEYFDAQLTAEHARTLKQRLDNGDITRGTYYHRMSGIDRITRLHETGKLLWEPMHRVSMYQSNDYYGILVEEFLGSDDFHANTRGDLIWVARSFFSWLVNNGHATLERVTSVEIQQYIVYCSGIMTSVSLYNVLLYMRKLCAYLNGCDLLPNAYTALLKMRVSRESKMYPAANHEEVAAILAQIDRSTVMGKRDYAVILLGAVMGIRAVDVGKLKLSDIDWAHGEIKLVQSKTGNTNMLPLTEDVGTALKDYILHARPGSVDDNVFIRLRPPFVALRDSWSIGDVYDRYRKRAGFSREAFDGKGFHSLRRALGKNMTTAGVALTSTAQVLGDADFNSAKKYISLDSENLKECALDFSGIEPGGEAK